MSLRNIKGITLYELLIVVAVIAIIASFAFPNYQRHTARARIADGKVKLLEIMQEQRKFFTDNNTYTTELITDLGYNDANGSGGVASDQELFIVTAAACGGGTIAQCVILSAVPQGALIGTDTLTYNSRNEKEPPAQW